ncbi:MAG: ATP-binding protein [Acidobacteriota bacterium]|nr:ATP-binding protein [Acidobacteriota bacterium]
MHAERLPLRKFTIADGLPHDHASRIFCDSRGFLWFATREGLARFDGNRFATLDNVPLLEGAKVRDIVETPAGTYWIATNRGLIQFVPGSPIEFRRAAVPLNVIALAAGAGNTVWAATVRGVFRVAGNTTERIESPKEQVYAMAEQNGDLWIGTEKGFYCRAARGTLTRLSEDDVREIVIDRQGYTWLATTTGLRRFRGTPLNGVERFGVNDGLPSDTVFALTKMHDGTIWAGTTEGLAHSEPGPRVSFRPYTSSHGISDRNIFTLAEDHDGDLWIGTESGGVFEIARSGFTSFTQDDGLTSNRIAAINEDRQGNLFVVSGLAFLHTFDGRKFHAWRPRFPKSIQYFGWGWNQIVLQARNGEWWWATGDGLCRFPPARSIADLVKTTPLAHYNSSNGLPTQNVFRIFEDSRGDIWASVLADGHSVVRVDHASGKVQAFGVADGMPATGAPNSFIEDRGGNLWVGLYDGGALRRRNGRFERIAGLPEGAVRDMLIDHRGRLWMAAESGGAVRIDNPAAEKPSIRVYTKTQGLSTNQIYSIVEDRFGRIYLGTGRGINRLDPESGRIKRFTTADGLPNNSINVAFADHTGALWFGTLNGLARLEPQRDEPRVPPPIWISALRVAGVPHAIPAVGAKSLGPFELEPHQNRVEVDFGTVTFRPGEAIRYQYRLAGDREWSAPVEQRSVALANLAPGNYNFEVRAISSDGIASTTPAIFRFDVLPPIWHRWWFMVSSAIAVIAAIHLYYRARSRRLLEMERVRIRIASDLHDDIGASLSRIAVLSEVVKRQVSDPHSDRMLADVADSARSAVESMSDIVWSIDPRRDDVVSLNRRLRECAAEILDPASIQWTFDSDSHADRLKLGPAQRRHIYLVVKETLTNAVRHAGCQHATIAVSAVDHSIRIEIADDGVGFDPKEAGNGNGLHNMRRRLAELGGDIDIATRNGSGTRVVIRIPLGRTA